MLATVTLIAAGHVVAVPGQRGSPDSARVSRIVVAVQRAGYANAAVIGHGGGATDALFVLRAVHGDSAVLVATLDPGRAAARPVVLERARTAADLGVRDVSIAPFLGARDLYDVAVNHQPFRLETNHTYSTHHVLRQQVDALSLACDLDGGSSSSYSKGIGSNTTTRTATIAKLPGTGLVFSVRIVARTVQRRDSQATPSADSSESVRWYELPLVGPCREVRAPRP